MYLLASNFYFTFFCLFSCNIELHIYHWNEAMLNSEVSSNNFLFLLIILQHSGLACVFS
jgi:hypothetical protein